MSNSIQTAYERDGFYIRERLLTEAECADLKTEAMRVMAAASSAPVWSFHSHACAAG